VDFYGRVITRRFIGHTKAQNPLGTTRHDTTITRTQQPITEQRWRKCGAHSMTSLTSLAANSRANVSLATIRLLFWLLLYVKIVTLLLSPKNVIDLVLSEGQLLVVIFLRKLPILFRNQTGRLRRKWQQLAMGMLGYERDTSLYVTLPHETKWSCRVVSCPGGPGGIWA